MGEVLPGTRPGAFQSSGSLGPGTCSRSGSALSRLEAFLLARSRRDDQPCVGGGQAPPAWAWTLAGPDRTKLAPPHYTVTSARAAPTSCVWQRAGTQRLVAPVSPGPPVSYDRVVIATPLRSGPSPVACCFDANGDLESVPSMPLQHLRGGWRLTHGSRRKPRPIDLAFAAFNPSAPPLAFPGLAGSLGLRQKRPVVGGERIAEVSAASACRASSHAQPGKRELVFDRRRCGLCRIYPMDRASAESC